MVPIMLAAAILSGCGDDEPDPNSGMYDAVSATAFGMEVAVDEVFEGGLSIELKNGGKAKFYFGDDDYSMKWKLDGDSFHAEGGGAELDGTLSNGVMALEDIMGSGIDIRLVCDDIANGSSGEGEDEASVIGTPGLLKRLKKAKNGKDVY